MLKQFLVNSTLGRMAFAIRERSELHRQAVRSLESLGCSANDMISRLLLERLCANDGIFIDVGSHIGSVVAGVAHHSRPAQIHAVEAMPEKVAFLRHRFPSITVHDCAAGDIEGEVEFVVDLERSGYSSLDPALKGRSGRTQTIKVMMKRLDDIMPHEGIDLIKLDVEGAELAVLCGAEALVRASRPTIMFESGPDKLAGFPAEALWQWFVDREYVVLAPNRLAHLGPGMTLDVFLDAHLYPRLTTNYFGVPVERRDDIRRRARLIQRFD